MILQKRRKIAALFLDIHSGSYYNRIGLYENEKKRRRKQWFVSSAEKNIP